MLVIKTRILAQIMANNNRGRKITLEPKSLVHYAVNMDTILTISPKSPNTKELRSL
jgi:hypothetical protein